MNDRTKSLDDAKLRLIAKRRELEAQVQDLQDDVRGTLGWAPRRSRSLLLGLAVAAGFALATFGVKRLRG